MKCIDATRKHNYGYIFNAPVDYVALNIPDYPRVIKRPMDLQTLRQNVIDKKYEDLSGFLKESALIWENCRTYNGMNQDGYYFKASNDIEKYFIQQLSKFKDEGFNVSWPMYKVLL